MSNHQHMRTIDNLTDTYLKDAQTSLNSLDRKGNYTVFNQQVNVEEIPIVQNSPASRLLVNTLYQTFTASGGSVNIHKDTGEINISIDSTVGSYALLRSKRPATYKPGFSIIARFSQIFDTPVANSLQMGGVGNSNSDIYIGYSGLNFGVRYSTNGRLHDAQLEITTASNTSSTVDITLNGVLYNVPVTNAGGNVNFTAYEISTFNYGSNWVVTHENNIVNFVASSVGPRNGTYSFVSNNATVGNLTNITTGNNLETTFVNLSDCNGDKEVIDNLNPQNYNMYAISYAWYGTSSFKFQVLINEEYRTIHTFRFTNNSTAPSLTFPSMYLQRFVASLGSTTPKTIKVLGSYLAYLGQERLMLKEPQYSIVGSKTFSGSEQPVISVKHRDDVDGVPIQAEFYLGLISVANLGTKNSIVRLYRNPTSIGNSSTTDFPEWRTVDASSITLFDTTSDTFSVSSTPILVLTLAPNDSKLVNLIDSGLYFGRGDTLCITADNSQSTEINICLQIIEFIS